MLARAAATATLSFAWVLAVGAEPMSVTDFSSVEIQIIEPGDIVDLDGQVLGRHDGIIHFTVGQRRGLGIAAPEPLYVVRVEPETRRVVAGPKAALLKDKFQIGDINWLGGGQRAETGLEITVKVRSTADPVAACLESLSDGEAGITLAEPQAGIAPGQACVFYAGERVLGGGWIRREN